MVVDRVVAHSWAYEEEIPNSHCSAHYQPKHDPWPLNFQLLPEDTVWHELKQLARPQSVTWDYDTGWRADSLNFQPSPHARTQDRYVVTQIDIRGRKWTLTGVFDGHLGTVTVEHVSHHLPIIVEEFLKKELDEDPDRELTTDYVADLFSRSILAFDDAIAHDVLDLFGGSIETLEQFSDEEIRRVINDQHSGGENFRKVRLCMYGTTALVALVDPDHINLWVANIGDCQAVLLTPDDDGPSDWKVEVLTTLHNAANPAEARRIRAEHPGEPECIHRHRVLGALAPTRCLGDIPFKLSPTFTRRILYNLHPGFRDVSPWEEFLRRNKTPPYVTAKPEIIHRKLRSSPSDPPPPPIITFTPASTDSLPNYGEPEPEGHTVPKRPTFLVLASDGFADLCGNKTQQRLVLETWARGIVELWYFGDVTEDAAGGSGRADDYTCTGNLALRLLRRALGDNRLSVSKVLTLESESAGIDDTTIIVQTV